MLMRYAGRYEVEKGIPDHVLNGYEPSMLSSLRGSGSRLRRSTKAPPGPLVRDQLDHARHQIEDTVSAGGLLLRRPRGTCTMMPDDGMHKPRSEGKDIPPITSRLFRPVRGGGTYWLQ